MGESDLHKYLKLLGIKYLDKQGCRLIATEIYVRKSASDLWLKGDSKLKERADHYNRYLEGIESRLKKSNDSDSKWVIDILAIGSLPIMVPDPEHQYGNYIPKKKIGTKIAIRGIEVKVSRSDFKSGYAQTGLHYHYLLCPESLIKKSDIPKHVGLLYWEGGKSNIITCVKRPIRQDLNTDMLQHYRDKIFSRYHSQIMSMTRDQLKLLREKM